MRVLSVRMGLRIWRKDPLGQALTAAALGVLIAVGAGLVAFDRSVTRAIHTLRSDQVLTAYVSSDFKTEASAQLVDEIQQRLGAKSADIRMVDGQDFMRNLRKSHPELAAEVDDLGEEGDSILPRHVSIQGVFSVGAVERIKTVPGVEAVESSRDRFQRAAEAFGALQWVGRALLLGLGLAVISLLSAVTRALREAFADSGRLMELMGGTPALQALPPLVSGTLSGGVAGGVAALLLAVLGRAVARGLEVSAPELASLMSVGGAGGIALYAVAAALFTTLLGGVTGWAAARASAPPSR